MADAQAAPMPNGFERRRRQNRAALLEAAIELFQARGIRGTKIEEICERAQVAQRTFFNHFETREHLYQAIAKQRADQVAAALDAQAADPRPFADRLRGLCNEIGVYLIARPAYRELVGEMLNLRLDPSNATLRNGSLGRAALRFIAEGVERGEITRRHPPEVLADLLLASITMALTNWSAGGDFDLIEAIGQSTNALLDLFEASPTKPPTA
jgi:AcrR family transcriptional regulator